MNALGLPRRQLISNRVELQFLPSSLPWSLPCFTPLLAVSLGADPVSAPGPESFAHADQGIICDRMYMRHRADTGPRKNAVQQLSGQDRPLSREVMSHSVGDWWLAAGSNGGFVERNTATPVIWKM